MFQSIVPNRIKARIKQRNRNDEYSEVLLLALGPLGVEVKLLEANPEYIVGVEIDTEIAAEGETTTYGGFIIGSQEDARLTIRFLIENSEDVDRRQGTRWICPPSFLPKAVAPTPGMFNEFIEFQIRNISSSGLELRTQSTYKSLLKGMLLRLTVSLPLVGDTGIIVKIIRVDVASNVGKEALSIGVEFVDANSHSRELLAQYLLQFGAINSFEEMRPSHEYGRSVANGITCSFLRSKKDYESLSLLRESAASNINHTQNLEKDLYSRLAIAFSEDKLVACIRVTFPDYQTPNESHSFPPNFPRKDQIVELSDFICNAQKGTEATIVELLAFIANTCLSGERPYLYCKPDETFAPVITRVGMTRIYPESEHPPEFIGHPIDSVEGTGANPIMWYRVWNSASIYLEKSKTISPVGVTRVMLRIYQLIGKLATMTARN